MASISWAASAPLPMKPLAPARSACRTCSSSSKVVRTRILNAFAVIALIAAGFGIVNTLLMSVSERTRERSVC